jgi:hypothetical protein
LKQLSLEGKPVEPVDKRICPLVRLPCLNKKCRFYDQSVGMCFVEEFMYGLKRAASVQDEGKDTPGR